MVVFPINILKPCGLQLSSDPKGVGHQIPNNFGIFKFFSEKQNCIFISTHLHIKYIPARHYQHSPDSKTVSATEPDVALWENCRMFLNCDNLKIFDQKKYLKKNRHLGALLFLLSWFTTLHFPNSATSSQILSAFKTCECVRWYYTHTSWNSSHHLERTKVSSWLLLLSGFI